MPGIEFCARFLAPGARLQAVETALLDRSFDIKANVRVAVGFQLQLLDCCLLFFLPCALLCRDCDPCRDSVAFSQRLRSACCLPADEHHGRADRSHHVLAGHLVSAWQLRRSGQAAAQGIVRLPSDHWKHCFQHRLLLRMCSSCDIAPRIVILQELVRLLSWHRQPDGQRWQRVHWPRNHPAVSYPEAAASGVLVTV